MWWVFIGVAAASETGPSWIAVAQGTARAELHAFPTEPLVDHPNHRCRGRLTLEGETLRVTEDRDGAQAAPPCDAAVLALLQSQAERWRLVVRSYRPRPTYSIPAAFVTGPQGELHLELEPRDYAVGPTHPDAIRLVEPGRRVSQRRRAPRLPDEAQAALASGAADSCSVVLQITPAGRVADAKAVESCDPRTRSHAEAMGRRMRFTPHRVNGQAEPRTLAVTVRMQP